MTDLTRALIAARLPATLSGAPPDGMSDAALRRGMEQALADRPADGDAGLWVFAYGALLWEREFRFDAERVAAAPGLVRRYCLWDDRNRGTPDRRGLTLGLIPGEGACSGAAIHLPGDAMPEALWAVWTHEMASGSYRARWIPVETAEGPLTALTFEAEPEHPLYAGELPEAEVAALLATRVGPGGPAAAYLLEAARCLRDRGVPDPRLERLQAMVADRLGGP